jgi:hypothetical protein
MYKKKEHDANKQATKVQCPAIRCPPIYCPAIVSITSVPVPCQYVPLSPPLSSFCILN